MVDRFPHRRLAVATAATVMTVLGTAGFQAASATSYRWPTAPSGVQIETITTSSLTVSLHAARYATRYQLWASPNDHDLFESNLGKKISRRKTTASSQHTLTVSSLSYGPQVEYYRVATINGPHRMLSPVYKTYLRPPAPTGLAISDDPPPVISWTLAPATGYTVVQSTNPSGSAGRVVYSLHSRATHFTPYRDLRPGGTYYFHVRALNGSSTSSTVMAGSTSDVPDVDTGDPTGFQAVRMLQYNSLGLNNDGTRDTGGGVIATWSKRRVWQAALIKKADPDIFTVEEAGSYTTKAKDSPRQVDSLRGALASIGEHYTIAYTEPPWGQTINGPCKDARTTEPEQHVLTGDYILYKGSEYTAVGTGCYIELPSTNSYAAFQELRNRSTGAKFLVVATHLISGDSLDAVRGTQAVAVLQQADSLAARDGNIPILVGGDFNSGWQPGYCVDTPGTTMLNGGMADAFTNAQSRTNAQYPSENKYMRTLSTAHRPIDHIYVSPGVAERSWAQLINHKGNQITGGIPSDHNPIYSDLLVPIVTS